MYTVFDYHLQVIMNMNMQVDIMRQRKHKENFAQIMC